MTTLDFVDSLIFAMWATILAFAIYTVVSVKNVILYGDEAGAWKARNIMRRIAGFAVFEPILVSAALVLRYLPLPGQNFAIPKSFIQNDWRGVASCWCLAILFYLLSYVIMDFAPVIQRRKLDRVLKQGKKRRPRQPVHLDDVALDRAFIQHS